MSEWQPIESAPRDVLVLIWSEDCGQITAHQQFGYWYAWFDWVSPDLKIEDATHWMPLPEPPKETK